MIKLVNVSKYYKTAFGVSEGMRRVNVSFSSNEFVAITGESGSGKSTLLNVLSGLDSYEDGELYINGEETSHYSVKDWEDFRSKNVGFVFQNYNVIDSYSVYQNVVFALEAQGVNPKIRKEKALELIERVGLTKFKNQRTSKLSGGQKQRVVIARALAKGAPIIMADEPTGNLDAVSGKEIMELLKEIGRDKLVILVTHNYPEAEDYITRKIVMHDAEIIEDTFIRKPDKSLETSLVEPEPVYKKRISEPIKFANRNLIATPKRTIFTLLLTMIAVAVFLFFYSTLVKNAESEMFNFDSANRFIVQNRDKTDLTKNQMEDLKAKYNTTFTTLTPYTSFLGAIQTDKGLITIGLAGQFLESNISGRLPRNESEVIITKNSSSKIGDTFYITNHPILDNFQVSVVGQLLTRQLADNPDLVYFYDSFFYDDEYEIRADNFIDNALNKTYTIINWGSLYTKVIIDEQVADDKVIIYSDNPEVSQYQEVSFIYYSKFGRNEFIHTNVEVRQTTAEHRSDDILINRATLLSGYKRLVNNYEIGIRAIDRREAKILMAKLDSNIYRIVDTYLQQEIILKYGFGILQLFFGVLLLLITMLLFLISYAVQRNVMRARKKDFAIYRSIGVNEKTVGWVIILEQLLIAIIAFIIVTVIMNVLGIYFEYFRQITRNLTIIDYLITSIVFSLFSIWQGFKFNRRVFGLTVITSLKEEEH